MGLVKAMEIGNPKSLSKRLIAILAAAISVIVILLIFGMRKSVNTSIYSERKELLGRLVESSALVINDNIASGQTIADTVSDNAQLYMPNYPDLKAYMTATSQLSVYNSYIFFFVDADGKYYSSDGTYGKIVDSTYYANGSEEKLSYISTLPHLDPEKVYLIYRNRLKAPIQITTGHGEAELVYSGILYDIDNLNELVSQEFAGDNNTFIYNDSNGVMMYKSFGIRLLIDGYNVYPKFSQSKIVYGEDPAALVQSCRNQETVVVALNINGEEYYFCSAPIAPKDWSVSFIVQSKYLNDVSGDAFGRIILYIALIFVLLGVAVVYLVVATYKNRAILKSNEEITKLNSDLESATRAKSDFLSNMSHDIRTPINGIIGMTAIAKGVPGNPVKTKECLGKIEGASAHLLSLINDVLDMTQIERGRTEIASKPIDILTVFDNCCSIIRGQISERALELKTEIDCVHHRVFGDELHLRQIFINILGNSVKFTKDGGTISFSCHEKEVTGEKVLLCFEIEDTGIGMKQEFLDKIFDPFSQDEGGARSEYKGTGLGMAIAKQLTDLMQGTIEVESELGKGSKFTVTVPFLINNVEEEEELLISGDLDLTGVKLLLVEDNELNMEIACELLEDAGAVITQAKDGLQALNLFKDNAPDTFDVILMDVMMPVMNGLEAAKAIRALDREDAKNIPILAMTANAFESDIKATREAGMNAHLSKPINIDLVIRTIACHVRKEHLEK